MDKHYYSPRYVLLSVYSCRRQALIQDKVRKNQIIRERMAKNRKNIEKNYLLSCCMESFAIGKLKLSATKNNFSHEIFPFKPFQW